MLVNRIDKNRYEMTEVSNNQLDCWLIRTVE